jgi:hypothetical protein
MTLVPKNTQRKNRIFNPDTRFGAYQFVRVQAPYSSGTPTTFATSAGAATTGRGPSAAIGEGVDFFVSVPVATPQGDGCGFGSVTINPKEQGTMCEFSFFYKKESGTMDGSQTSTHSMEIWIRDQSNASWIQPIGYRNIANVTGNVNKCQCFFQVPYNCTTLYLCLLNNNAAAAYQLGISDCYFGVVQTAESGFPASDWQAYTPVLEYAGNATSSAYWRRVGDSMEIMGSIIFGSTLPTGNYAVELPPGYLMDTSKLVPGNQNIGIGHLYAGSGTYVGGTTIYGSFQFGWTSGPGTWWNSTNPATIAATNSVTFTAKFPIQGWSSNQQMASQLGNTPRQVNVYSGTLTSIPSGSSKYGFNTIINDESGWFDIPTNSVTIKEPGFYTIDWFFDAYQTTGSNQTINATTTLNTNPIARSSDVIPTATQKTCRVSSLEQLKPNDVLEFYLNASTTFTTSTSPFANRLMVTKIPNPATTIPSPNILSVYGSTSGVLLPTSPTNYNWEVKVTDLTGAVTTGAGWQFVAQISGPYNFSFNLVTNYSSTINAIHLAVRVNSTTVDYGYTARLGAYSTFVQTRCAGTTWMNAGDTMICWAWQDTSVDTTYPDIGLNRAMIVYVGR